MRPHLYKTPCPLVGRSVGRLVAVLLAEALTSHMYAIDVSLFFFHFFNEKNMITPFINVVDVLEMALDFAHLHGFHPAKVASEDAVYRVRHQLM